MLMKGGRRSIAALVLLTVSTMMLWSQEMNEKFSMTTQMFLNELKEKITVQEIKNEEMQKLYDSTGSDFSKLAEQIARDDLDYIKEGERVFVNVSGE